MNFTDEQIYQIREANFNMLERVFDDEPWSDTTDELIKELTKPKFKPQVGEGYAYCENSGKWSLKWCEGEFWEASPDREYRPLNRTEVPALGVALDALKDIYERTAGTANHFKARDTITLIKQMIGES